MSGHDYIVLGMGTLWMVTNILGAAFTIRHVGKLRTKRALEASYKAKELQKKADDLENDRELAGWSGLPSEKSHG